MPVELALGATSLTLQCLELTLRIIKSAEKARQFKSECQKASKIADILQSILGVREDVLETTKTGEQLKRNLLELEGFVKRAQSPRWRLVRAWWEVSWRNRLPELLGELMGWIAVLKMELGLSDTADIRSLLDLSKSGTVTLHSLENRLEESTKIQTDIRNHILELSTRGTTLTLNDLKALPIQSFTSLGLDSSGHYQALYKPTPSSPGIPVLLNRIPPELVSSSGARPAFIYKRLMDVNILVHPFYGIVSIEGFYWAVMKDFREFKSLAMALQDAEWRAAKRYRDRVRIAYLISKTVAFLHSVDLLVKRLGDVSVVMVEQGGNEVPYLTGLEQARFIYELTSGGAYDVRYEAPEFTRSREHSKYTDIWSVGFLIWQIVSGSPPYGYVNEVLDDDEAAIVRRKRVSLTFDDVGEPVLRHVRNLVERCCSDNKLLRPTAEEIEEALRDIVEAGDEELNVVRLEKEVDFELPARVEATLKKHNGQHFSIDNDDAQELFHLVEEQGNPQAALLLGQAILNQAVDVSKLKLQQNSYIPDKGAHHASLSIPYLELANEAGRKIATVHLQKAHSTLERYYRNECETTMKLHDISNNKTPQSRRAPRNGR